MNPWGVFRTKWCISRVTRLFIKLHELYKYRVTPLIVTLNDTHILVGNEATDLWPEANGIRRPLGLARKLVATWFLDVSLTSQGNQILAWPSSLLAPAACVTDGLCRLMSRMRFFLKYNPKWNPMKSTGTEFVWFYSVLISRMRSLWTASLALPRLYTAIWLLREHVLWWW